ncbi:helix-turn-helix domain-containing protein [Pseudonocardia bannensis]|uniref:Uncharacterized protein n=1 Tax=Pseudonocardia bannensis TaxID=630973 RepID=A0A848DK81_9PSEU|nr:hypothetical protein [Pseudonocardia bannensis]NMH92936.1 hypothetical protein [Pseudonocardia bannensis]
MDHRAALDIFFGETPEGTQTPPIVSAGTPDAAAARLEAGGLLADGVITGAGRRFRDEIEARIDDAQAGVVAALGAEPDPPPRQLGVWSQRCVAARTFPPDVRERGPRLTRAWRPGQRAGRRMGRCATPSQSYTGPVASKPKPR